MPNLNNWIMCTERTPDPRQGPGQGGWHTENRDSSPVLLAVLHLEILGDAIRIDHHSEPYIVEAWYRQSATHDPDGDPYDMSDPDDAADARAGWYGSLGAGWSSDTSYSSRAVAWQPYPSTAELRNL